MALGRPCSAPFYSSRALAGLCLPYRGRATSPRFTSSRTTWARPHVETSRPEASANAPPSTPRPRQIELGAASSRGQPPPIGRCIHWLATPAFYFHIGGSRSARARPARSRSRTTARSHCGLRRVGRRPKVKARGDGNGKEFNCEPRGVPRPAAHSSAVAQSTLADTLAAQISNQQQYTKSLLYLAFYLTFRCYLL